MLPDFVRLVYQVIENIPNDSYIKNSKTKSVDCIFFLASKTITFKILRNLYKKVSFNSSSLALHNFTFWKSLTPVHELFEWTCKYLTMLKNTVYISVKFGLDKLVFG
ncbi:hypothetical protein CHS0354_037813 [Potamilus streckersoni]|uniref:Uncharacterized protein n=1 Tax=Potamilus streckersoni TaxID=2493646 RepID=A0AAE0SMS5_9BIVA|nr:hypothetical protein CHS0354_037813 [Potamilus streckersoni]